ncbi:MAG TPA: hypothetical protein PLH92_16190 [Mycobacterium sp.]|nr:hypothetical protein [Mycobacterium sp.]
MRVVVVLALAALAALIVALVSGSTLAAILVVMLALAGIVLLVRDWRAEPDAAEQASDSLGTIPEPGVDPLTADELSPDIADQL